MRCQFCQKECKNLRSFKAHERTCPSNPNRRYTNGMTGKAAWNKNLTRDTDSRVAAYAKTLSDRDQPRTGCFSKDWYGTEAAQIACSKGRTDIEKELEEARSS